MKKIIGDRSTGKTRKLLELAKQYHYVVVCKNVSSMKDKALAYGIYGLQIISYADSKNCAENDLIVIDDIDEYLKFSNPNVKGFTVSIEDEHDRREDIIC